MSLEARELAELITSNVSSMEGEAAQSPQEDFCSIWPKAKPVLEFVSGVVIFIPGAGVTAGAVLQGLLKVGDQVASQICRT